MGMFNYFATIYFVFGLLFLWAIPIAQAERVFPESRETKVTGKPVTIASDDNDIFVTIYVAGTNAT